MVLQNRLLSHLLEEDTKNLRAPIKQFEGKNKSTVNLEANVLLSALFNLHDGIVRINL